MDSSTNLWMGLALVVYLIAGAWLLRKDILAARGWDRFIALASPFIAASLAAFAPEHFKGPEFVQAMVPRWMPWHLFWAYFVGCALIAAATSLTVRKHERLCSTLLGLMFLLFVSILYLPSAIRHPASRFAWAYACRDLSFSAGGWALAAVHSRASSPRIASFLTHFARLSIAIAATFYGVEHFLHPDFVLGVPLENKLPAWVPIPILWAWLGGAVLVAAGLFLAFDKRSRPAATAVGAVMTFFVVCLYLPILILSLHGSVSEINEAINYVADTLLFAGSALALAAAIEDPPGSEQNVPQAGSSPEQTVP